MATSVDTTDIVAAAEKYHKTSAVVTAALGRLLTAASMMGNMLKGEKDSLTLRIKGDGPVGAVIAVSDSHGNVKGYAVNPVVELPLNNKGKLDVSGCVGKNGTLFVSKDIGLKEPYNGFVPLATGEIAEDITYYYAESEQIPTVCALGVLVNPDLSVRKAGGFIIQLLPGADDKTIEKLENSVKKLEAVTKMMDAGKSHKDILFTALEEFETEVLYETDIAYKCDCSKTRAKKIIGSMDKKELEEMALDKDGIEVVCHFCDKKYKLTQKELEELVKKQ